MLSTQQIRILRAVEEFGAVGTAGIAELFETTEIMAEAQLCDLAEGGYIREITSFALTESGLEQIRKAPHDQDRDVQPPSMAEDCDDEQGEDAGRD